MIDNTILEVKQISKRFPGVLALNHASFSVRKGEVHALLGENGAGKSTLMKCLLGIHSPDEGEIIYKGKPFHPHSPSEALSKGISMIHQEITLVPPMTVSENIWLGREKNFSKWGFWLDKKARTSATKQLLQEYELEIEPDALADRRLSIANLQLVEIVRAISYNSDIIIMDEPTSALSDTEISILFKIIKILKSRGTAIIFISHKLDEVLEVADRITILRDGQTVMTNDANKFDNNSLIKHIVGREVSEIFPKLETIIKDKVLEVKHLTSRGVFKDVSFHISAGEIVGLCGLMGAGRSEIARAIFGIDRYDSGEIFMSGKKVDINDTADAIRSGIGMVTEDRLRMGIISRLSVQFNTVVAKLSGFRNRLGFMDDRTAKKEALEVLQSIDTRYASLNQTISSLSGGNQQKVIIGRWLLMNPKLLILDEPTRGIDVGSKSEIHLLISSLAQKGMAVLMISSELPEVMGMSDRILTVKDGSIVAEHERKDFNAEEIMKYAFGSLAPMER